MTKILIAYASAKGSTRGVAGRPEGSQNGVVLQDLT